MGEVKKMGEVPCWAVVVSLIVCVGLTIANAVWFFNAGIILYDFVWTALCGFAAIYLIVWLWRASSMVEVDYTENCEVKVVTYPDGKQAQMFTANGRNYNANLIFGCLIPEGAVVERVVYKKSYLGIYYSDLDMRKALQDTYRIVDKINDQPGTL